MPRMSACRVQGCARAPPICRHGVAFMLVNSILVLYNKYHGMNKKKQALGDWHLLKPYAGDTTSHTAA